MNIMGTFQTGWIPVPAKSDKPGGRQTDSEGVEKLLQLFRNPSLQEHFST